MRTRQRSQVLAQLKWDLLIASLVLCGWWVYSSFEKPRLRPAVQSSAEGSRPPDRAEGDTLVLLPDSPAADATNLDELDCSYFWFNALWREYGSFATALTRDLSPEILAGRHVVFVPARVTRSMPPAGVQLLSDFVRDGGQLVLELPTESWSTISGVLGDRKGGARAQKVTSVDGLNVHGPLRQHLTGIPLRGQLISSPPLDPYPAGPMIMEVDSQPGWLQIDHGAGRVHSLLFNFACSLAALQQGTPTKDMHFAGTPDALIPTSSRANSSMMQAEAPAADLLTRALLERLNELRPLPRLWLFPSTFSGALMMTHAAPGDPRAAFGFAEAAAHAGGTSTVFAASDRFTPTHAAIGDELHVETGLFWVRGHTRPKVVDPTGVGGFSPVSQELSLDAQFMRLNLNLPAERALRVARVEQSLWSNDWDTTFKEMAASRVRMDSSFGPTEPEQFGYLFGSGFPFYPIDLRGLPLPLLEQPYLIHADGITRSRLVGLLENSSSLFHQPIVISLPADAMRTNPSPGILLAFRDVFGFAKKYDHWVTNLGEFLDFLASRRKSILTSRWNSEERLLTITLNLIGTPSKTIEKGAFAGLAVPRTFGGQEVESVLIDEVNIPLREVATNGANTDRIIRVPGGRHTIEVRYLLP